MKIVLANIPWNRNGKKGVRAGSRWPHLKDDPESNYLPFPFFLAYSASLLESEGFEVKLMDAICDDMTNDTFAEEVIKYNPDIILVETSTVTLEDDIAFIKKYLTALTVALCGPDVNIRSRSFLEHYPFITYILKEEYEFTLLDLLQHLRDKQALKDVLGLNYRDEAGTIKENASRPLGSLDDLPWPKRDTLCMERYIDSPGAMPFPTVQMLASRGCPYQCLFCLWPQVMYGGYNYRVRNHVDVLNEMEHLINVCGFKSVYFDDDTFGLRKEWTHAFCDEFIKRNEQGSINVPWAIMTRPDVVDEEILHKLKACGLWAIKYGVESGNQSLVNNIKKNLDLRYAEKIIHLTHRLGIKTHLTFTFGLPGETKETIKETIAFVRKLDPFTVQFSITTPFPGTKYFDELERKGKLLSKDWNAYDGNTACVIKNDVLSPEDLVAARRRAYEIWKKHTLVRRIFGRLKKFFAHN